MAPIIGGDWRSELRELHDGWDGEKGRPITDKAISTVETFSTVPTSAGGIQLEVHRDGWDVEIDIGPDGRITSVLVCRE